MDKKKVDKNKIIEDILSTNPELDKETVETVVESFGKHVREHILNGDEILFWGLFSVSYMSINNKNVAVKPGKTDERMVLNGVRKPHIKLSKSIHKAWKEKNKEQNSATE